MPRAPSPIPVLRAAAALLLPLLALSAPAWGQASASGQYGSLTLSVTEGRVLGAFSEGRMGNGSEAAPQFSCRFLLRGQLKNGVAVIETWYPGGSTIPGRLSLEGGEVALTLEENQDGCAMASGDMTRAPYRAARRENVAGWTGAALVAAERAAFRPSPGAPAPRRPYVVEGDPVAVLERREGWARVIYAAGARPVTGWLRDTELTMAGAAR